MLVVAWEYLSLDIFRLAKNGGKRFGIIESWNISDQMIRDYKVMHFFAGFVMKSLFLQTFGGQGDRYNARLPLSSAVRHDVTVSCSQFR